MSRCKIKCYCFFIKSRLERKSNIIENEKKQRRQKMEKKLLSKKETAKYLSLGISTIDKFLAMKKLKPVRLGRRVLFLQEDLDKFILENREK